MASAREHCARHPHAVAHAGHCPACLLEHAVEAAPGETGILTIQLPLGRSASASVWLVRDESSSADRMLRLKTWRTPAPIDFLARVTQLQARLDDWGHPRVARVVASWLDEAGCPAVLSGFRQGVPILDAISSGVLDPVSARARLSTLLGVLRAAQARGLAHGSVSPGNVIVRTMDDAADLLDFGMRAVLSGNPDHAALARADGESLAALERRLRDASTWASTAASL